MISVMTLLKTTTDLTDEVIRAHLPLVAHKDPEEASVQRRTFNRIIDRTQKGIQFSRGTFEVNAIPQFDFADISASLTAADEGAVNLAMGLSPNLVDGLELILCLRNTVIEPPAETSVGLKRMSILRKRPDVSPEAFQDQWFNLHALLVKRLPGIQGYRQNLVIDGGRDSDGNLIADGMVELWFPDEETIERAFRSDIGATTMTHAREFISEITTYLVDPIEIASPA